MYIILASAKENELDTLIFGGRRHGLLHFCQGSGAMNLPTTTM
jgi:hypothetical protein